MGGSINNVDRLVRTMTSPPSRRGRGSVGDAEKAVASREPHAITGMYEHAHPNMLDIAFVRVFVGMEQNYEQVRT